MACGVLMFSEMAFLIRGKTHVPGGTRNFLLVSTYHVLDGKHEGIKSVFKT